MRALGTVAELASNWAGNGFKSATLSRFDQDPVSKFLARGKVCRGPLCLSSNPAGLSRVPEMFAQGFDVCDLCANTMSAAELSHKKTEQKEAKAAKREGPKPVLVFAQGPRRMGKSLALQEAVSREGAKARREEVEQKETKQGLCGSAALREKNDSREGAKARGEEGQPQMARMGVDRKNPGGPVIVMGYDPARPHVDPLYVAIDKDGKATPHVVGHRTGRTGVVFKDEFELCGSAALREKTVSREGAKTRGEEGQPQMPRMGADFNTPKQSAVTSRPAETGARAPGGAEARLPRAAKPQTQPTHVAPGESALGAPRRSGVAQRARDDDRGGVDLCASAPLRENNGSREGAKDAKESKEVLNASAGCAPLRDTNDPRQAAKDEVAVRILATLENVQRTLAELRSQLPGLPLNLKLSPPKVVPVAPRARRVLRAAGTAAPSLVPGLLRRLARRRGAR